MVLSDEKVADLTEYEVLAKQKLPKMVYDFYAGGAEDEYTLRENVAAFHRIRVRPTTLSEVKQVDLSTTVLGFKISMPIMIAPTAMHRMAHPEGELATARAAMSVGTIMMLSFTSTCSIEEVAAIGDSVLFFQLFLYKRREIIEVLVHRAEKAGYKAVILTGDCQRLGRREADIRNRFALPPNLTFKNLEGLIPVKMDRSKGSGLPAFTNELKDMSLCWKDIQWLKSITHLPILVKGILTGEDAATAVQAGVSGVIVSNHGGRQLDCVSPTIVVLEEVALAVGGRVPILFDGGIRSGRDVFKALALGADAVLIGRPVIFGLAVDGEVGVRNVLQQLHDELRSTMILAGCSSLKDIERKNVQIKHEKSSSKL